MNITKKDIALLVSKKINTTNDESLFILNSFFQILKKQLQHNDIKLSKFGVFYTKKTKPRIGRNPKTMETYKIPSVKKVFFRSSKITKDILN